MACSAVWLTFALLGLRAASECGAAVLLSPAMRTFGNALKAFPYKAGVEQVLFQFSEPPAPGQTAPHVITEQWFSLFGGEHPFDIPQEWLDKEKELDLSTPFNFVATCDIIGGNSGPPMIDKDQNVVGLIFDGNIEMLGNRYVFDDEVSRTVSVHTAIIIESLRKIYGAGALADELERKGAKTNDTCPVSGMPVDADYVVDYEGRQVAFCCGKCKAKFEKDPAKYAGKLAGSGGK